VAALAAGTLALVIMVVWRFGTSTDLDSFFWVKRFVYPVGYPNNNAALFLILFWPLLWMAADPREHWFVRGPVLGLCAAVLMLAIPTQSRGGLWVFALTVPLMLLFSTARLRTLVHLALPVGVTAAAFPALNSYWNSGASQVGSQPLVRWVLLGVAIAAGGGVVMALIDRRLRLGPRLRLVLGTAALVAVVVLAFVGLAAFERTMGSPRAWLTTQWQNLSTDTPTSSDTTAAPSTRYLALSTSGRWTIWRVGWNDFRAHPLTGIGAGSFPYSWAQHRTWEAYTQTVHSIVLQTLGDTGIVGAVLFFGALLVGAGLALWRCLQSGWRNLRRFGTHLTRRGPPQERGAATPDYSSAWTMALLVALLYWLGHSTIDWLWHMPAVTIPMLLFLALAMTGAQHQTPRRPQTPSPAQVTPPPRRAAERTFRWAGAAVSVLIVVGLLLPYLAGRYQDAALANTTHDPLVSVAQTRVAALLNPVSPDPFTVQSRTYRAAAVAAATAPTGEGKTAEATATPAESEATGAKLDNLALALWAADGACRREPQGWVVHYQAAQAALELATAQRDGPGTISADEAIDPSSLAVDAETTAAAGLYQAMTVAELRSVAEGYALRAQELNPLERRIALLLEEIAAPTQNADTGN